MQRPLAMIAALVFSGAAGLIYEVIWIRRAALVFGSTTFALSTVLGVFFLGLAVGSYLFGRLSRRIEHPLRLFAALEVGLAVLGLLTLPGFTLVESLYGQVYRVFPLTGAPLWLARGLLVALVLLPPTVLMGGTLPVVCRALVHDRRRIGTGVATLYAANTLGAAAGCAAAGFVLIPAIGMQRSVLLAALLDLAVGLVVAFVVAPAWARARPRPPRGTAEEAGEGDRLVRGRAGPAPPPLAGTRWVALLFFSTGLVALGQEVVWSRFLSLIIRNNVHTVTVTLTVVLAGIVLGSVLAGRLADRMTARGRAFGACQILAGLSALALLSLTPDLWRALGTSVVPHLLLFLPSAALSGASFPLAVRMTVNDPALSGAGVGRLTAVNTLGGIVGSIAVGFWLLPRFGLETSILTTTGLSLLTGFIALIALDRTLSRPARVLAVAISLAIWIALPRLARTQVPEDFLAAPGELIDHREGLESNLAVVRREGRVELEIDRTWQGRSEKTHQILAAHIPMILHPAPRSVLVVGVGVGQTAQRFLLYDVERLDCVDIEPAIFDLIRRHFAARWLEDPRVADIRDDGRNYVAHAARTYDVISLELGQLFRPGVASFYTEDFYRLVRERLAPDGIVAQFVPLPFLDPDALRSVIASFLAVFPGSTLWYNTSELLLVGGRAERLLLEPARLELLTSGEIAEDLRYSHWGGPRHWLNQPAVFLGGFLMGREGLAGLAGSANVYDDDRPILAYATSDVTEADPRELANLALLRRHLEPIGRLVTGLDATLTEEAERVRERNLADVEASFLLRQYGLVKDVWPLPRTRELVERAIRANPENAIANRIMGEVLIHLGRVPDAALYFTSAIAMRPDDAYARRGMAFVLHSQGNPAGAVPHYEAALGTLDADAEVHNNLGAALAESGDAQGARLHFERALALRPGWRSPADNLARLQASR